MKRFLYAICFVLSCTFTSSFSYAENNLQSTDNTTIEVFNNGKDTIFAKFTLKPGWHIYWSNPGEVGLPTVIKAPGSNLEIINQSVPQIHTIYENIDEYLYEDNAYYEMKLDNPNNATLLFEFVECNNVCKPEKLTFDMAKLSPTDDKTWQEIQISATSTFPQKIKLTSPMDYNEVLFKTTSENIKFIPAEPDIVDAQTISISNHKQNADIKWQSQYQQQLKQALIVTPEKSYFADITYENSNFSFLYAIILAFLGGIILNAMPCVFPILSLKIFALLKQRKRSKARARMNAFLYTIGVLFSFILLTLCLIVLKKSGEAVGWGFQMQSIWFVGFMAVLFLLLFLYMMEWINFPDFANKFIHKVAGINDFTTGFFAVLVASPCTGPFMGAAVGYAFMRSDIEIFAVFVSLALGYALPYALIELFPKALNHLLPKPGKWMQKVKVILAIPVLLTSIWLSTVWYKQLTDSYSLSAESESDKLNWQPFNMRTVTELNNANENIFIDFTADWCLTCKFNEKFLIDSSRFKNFVKQNNVHLFQADLTEYNEIYNQALTAYGRDSIPLYVYYSNGNYKILPLFFRINDLKNKMLNYGS